MATMRTRGTLRQTALILRFFRMELVSRRYSHDGKDRLWVKEIRKDKLSGECQRLTYPLDTSPEPI